MIVIVATEKYLNL